MQENLAPVQDHQDAPVPKESFADGPATLFTLYWPMLRDKVENKLSAKSLRRLIKAMICVPLEDAKLNIKLDEEREAYAIIERLMEAKLVMILSALYEHQEELQKLNDEQNSQPKQENNDGEIKTTDGR